MTMAPCRMRRASQHLMRGLVALTLVLFANMAFAQDLATLQSTRQAANAAFQSGDMETALALSEKAVAIARASPDTSPSDAALALNALAFVLTSGTMDSRRAASLWSEALAHLGESNEIATEAKVTVLINLGTHEIQQGHRKQGLARLDTALATARGTPLHGVVALATQRLFLEYGAYARGILALEDLTRVAPELLNDSFAALYAKLTTLIEQAEADDRPEDVVTLLEGKQIVLRQYLPEEQATPALRNLFFQRFFALRNSGDDQRVRNELTLWLNTGTPSDEERQFIQDMVKSASLLSQGGGINSLERLSDARMAVAFAAGLDAPDNYRIGLTLWAIASAESHLGQFDQVERTLGQAIDILGRSDTGRGFLPAVYSELAWNTFLLDDPDRASALYDRADQAQSETGPAGNDTATLVDRASDAANRARFHLDTGQPELALYWQDQARALIQATAGADPWQTAFLNSRLIQISLLARFELEQSDGSPDDLLDAMKALRAVSPANNPEYSMALVNAADTALFMGRKAAGRSLLNEAIAINDTALPDIAPQAVATLAKLAQLEIVTGNWGAATALLKRVGDARKSPLYRSQLPASANDFELLAWGLLQDRETPGADDLNTAFEALQWTQVTQSAKALGFLETRLAIDDPARGALIRERQTLVEALSGTMDRLALARTASPDADKGRPASGTLTKQIDQLEVALASADARLNAFGLDTGGIGGVQPVSIHEVQAMLGPDEALITFLLPSLNPDVVEGLTASSNQVIAVTSNTVRIAPIDEISRAGLNRRISAFRCDVAISDPGCGQGGAKGMRGAMLADDDEDSPPVTPQDYFDYDAAFSLYSDLFGGIQDVLEVKSHLIIVPTADMLRLPFQALITEPVTGQSLADAPWMIRQNAISILPSIASLRALRTQPDRGRQLKRMLGFGDPAVGRLPDTNCGAISLAALRAAPPQSEHMSNTLTADGIALADTDFLNTLERLPDSVCELRAIGARFDPAGVQLFIGRKATESRIKAMNKSGALAEFDVLVFATHGLTAGQAGAASPGLVLTPPGLASPYDDGLLSAAEIAGLDLNAQLVVLSACNTAAGETGAADGLSGLARAFFRAGAQSLLVTHWAVYSQAAVDITTGLFAQLADDTGMPYSVALRAATLDILGDPQRPLYQYHPSYWAPFSIIGAT